MFVWNIEQGKTDEMFYKDNTRKLYMDYKMKNNRLVDSQYRSSHICHI